MKMNIGIIYDKNGHDSTAVLFGDYMEGWEKWFEITFSPDIKTTVLQLAVHGKTYRERQESLRGVALDYCSADLGGLSYGELEEIREWFEDQGRKYGLLGEFRDNYIC